MHQKWTEVLIGLFVAVAVALVMWLIVQMGSRAFKQDYRVSALFKDVEGLGTGVSVRMAGYRIGEVSDIEFLPPGKSHEFGKKGVWVRVVMDIDRGYPIAKDAELRLNPQLVLGEVYLDVSVGDISQPLPQDGSGVIEKVVIGKTAIEQAVDDAMIKIDRIEVRLNTFLDGMNNLLDFLASEDMRKNFKETVKHTRKITERAAEAMDEFDNLIKDTDRMVVTGEHAFAQVEDLIVMANESFTQFNQTALAVESKAAEGIKIFQDGTGDLRKAAAEFVGLLDRLNGAIKKREGSLGLLLNSPKLHDSVVDTFLRLQVTAAALQRAAARVENTAASLEKHPSALIWGRTQHPEPVTAGGQTIGPNDIGIE